LPVAVGVVAADFAKAGFDKDELIIIKGNMHGERHNPLQAFL